MIRLAALSAALASCALAYVRTSVASGAPMIRPDFANVQFFLNQNIVAGMTNSDGKVMITPDSDVNGALQAAMNTWNAVTTSAARFLPAQPTTLLNSPFDRSSVIVLTDSPSIRSMLGNALSSLTIVAATSAGNIVDSDIILNPVNTYSSTGAPDTYDLQAVLTKALGASLGANSSGVYGAALCVTVGMNSTVPRTLSPDDIAFASAVYPADPTNPNYGALSGTLTLGGAPVRTALVSAVDPVAGTALATLTNSTNGTWSMLVPPGNYQVYAQPLVGPIIPAFFANASFSNVDTNFTPGFLGGVGSPSTVAVTAQNTTDASFDPGQTGGSTINLFAVQALPVGKFSAGGDLYPLGITAPTTIVSGQSVDLVIQGAGIDASLSDANIVLLGPITLRPGTIKQDPGLLIFNDVPLPEMRFTVDIPAVGQQAYATLLIVNNGTFAAYTGGLVLLPPPSN